MFVPPLHPPKVASITPRVGWLTTASAAAAWSPSAGSGASATNLGLYVPFEELAQQLGGTGRAKSVWQSIRSGRSISPRDDPAVSEHARRYLKQHGIDLPAVIVHTSSAHDGTTKLLVELREDGRRVESVIIPHFERRRTQAEVVLDPAREARSTLCVSSQVGCRQACAFCATGTRGLLRNLAASEIVAQVHLAQQLIRESSTAKQGTAANRAPALPPLSRLVFMGEGDAGANLRNVRHALRVLTDTQGFGMSRTSITVSTVGLNPSSVLRMADLPALLAWSLHTADDALRKTLVPTATHSVAELRDAFGSAMVARSGAHQRVLRVGITMLHLINDHEHHAHGIADLLLPLQLSGDVRVRVCVDLIPYNIVTLPGFPQFDAFRPSSKERIWAFQRILRARGLTAFVRMPRGDEAHAACGQLVNEGR
ncbi:Dual-specificity RNA methyltransferase RlmN [Porphyridium purpureum]|uniref:Dual-specificity RNA methyltransferase RlmN n=1 Tax=Porphyridium purpureum TaxID=35688 RepID=A0A5J4Z2H7_PORPP|nr:Dual-specificity RNA methyltransferase RlmN [Porphyridium purpureum]|eukprot:POR4838..scf295_1